MRNAIHSNTGLDGNWILPLRSGQPLWLGNRENSNGRLGPSHAFKLHRRSVEELLHSEIFYSQREAQIIIEKWRNHPMQVIAIGIDPLTGSGTPWLLQTNA